MTLPLVEYVALICSLLVSIALSFKSYRFNKNAERSTLSHGLSLWSISVSLIASNTSGVSFLGKPSEAYTHGVEFQFYFTICLICHCMADVFVLWPIFKNLKGPSMYEYFERRFDSKVKMLTIAQFVIFKIINTAITALPAAMVISHFSGFGFVEITVLLIGITTFYTMIGDLRGVILTDAFQGIVMFVSFIVLCSISVWRVGGVGRVIQIASNTDRFSPAKISFDPRQRLTIWAYVTGLMVTQTFHQSSYQRYKLLTGMKEEVNHAIIAQYVGMFFFSSASCFVGLAVFAYYYGCDPKEAQLVSSYSNLMIYWLDDVGSQVVGLRGLFIAGITCASISTISTNINTVATMVNQDILQTTSNPVFGVRVATVAVGILVSLCIVAIENTESLVELMFGIACIEGMSSGLLWLGIIFVRANSTGALIGGFSSVTVSALLLTISKMNSNRTVNMTILKAMRTDLCPWNVTRITETELPPNTSLVSFVSSLSPFIYGGFSMIVTVATSLAVSFISPRNDSRGRPKVRDSDLYVPWVRARLTRFEDVPSDRDVHARCSFSTAPLRK